MQTLTLYLTTGLIFLVLDALMLTLHMQPLFQKNLGAALLASPRYLPAAAFYAAYIAGLLYLVSIPALKTGAPLLIPAAILGAMAYGTYEFTSYAVMKDWTAQMLITDLLWGTVLTATSAWGGVFITHLIFKG